ncbi:FG-GAP-like repeat-containing protein [Microbacterium profundi]|uniref:FG-GAP repeat domain-containing protein n=1 Tax=Microbacterium profundi TaxID=450380 RepID=UPI0027DFFA9A|nr:VCBS repeat-containing protein [Microbacterium profundi]MCE7482849.1 FG-GAP-like repeat-containing protein [Microbacterium profundi]
MTAVVVGTVAPVAVATASASQSTTASLARTAGDPAQTGIVKTSLAGFSAGNIISDAVFTNKSTMTEAQIQSFFNGKVSRCQSGYVCLKDFKISSVNRPADAYCSGYTGAANESAARIIYRVAQSCNINPQVLIVMLQKEQGLISHTWPSSWRYDSALGQGCPDTAPCDPNFVGFFHQIYGAARQMQIYMEGKWFQWYAPGNTWNLRYHPNAACGSSPVYVANKATSALYYYTPYQPNAAALAAGYGEANNTCSSYGNRNFYNYFTDWFGSTQVPVSAVPTLSSVNTSSYITAVDSSGTLWGYPFSKRVWGDRKQLATGIAAGATAMAVGDLSGDGNRDLVLKQPSGVSIMSGTGTGFSAPTPLALDWSSVVLSTAAGDFDSDGIADVITTAANGDLMLWRGTDRGTMLAGVRIGWGWASMNALVGGLDLNRDGNTDIIARDTSGRLWGYYSNGSGGWSGQQQLGHGWGGLSAIFSPGDFTGDGVPDIAGRTANGDLWLYPGNGVGSIMGGGKVGNGWQIMTSLDGAGELVTAPRAFRPGAGDVDTDGAADVVAITTQGALNLYRGNGAGAWRGSTQIGTGWAVDDRLVPMGDFNGDGYKDMGRVTAKGQFYLYPGRAGGGYDEGFVIGTGWNALTMLIGGVDFDGDRNLDVIARDGAGKLVMYRGNGNGGWASQAIAIGYGWAGFDAALYAGDFDGDGIGDLILRRTDATLWVYPTDGRGGWGTPRQIGQGWGTFTALLSPGDFDRNGTMDVIGRSANGDLYLFRGDGRGGWGASGVIGRGWNTLTSLG